MSSVLPRRTFYRRPLPPSCIALSSPKGRKIFESALKHKGLKSYFSLTEQFTTQSDPAFCGISSLVMVLNALAVDPRRLWKGPWRWYHEELLNCCMDLEQVKQTGITLNVFSCLARCQGLQVQKYHVQDRKLQDFRLAIELACVDHHDAMQEEDHEQRRVEDSTIGPLLVVSYDRGVLNQTGTGHFSPVAAFDRASDFVLILDTARFKYSSHWVPVPLLFEAMKPIDPHTGISRGYVLLSYHTNESDPVMPISILIRSPKAKNPVRKEYREFLLNRREDVTWDEVVSFWTKNGSDANYIWEIMEPQLSPTEADEIEAVENIRTLVQHLLPVDMDIPREYHQCRDNANRAICLAPQEAIFIVYLASIPPEPRQHVVYSERAPKATSNISRQQLLVEADLVHFAIEMSDELDSVESNTAREE